MSVNETGTSPTTASADIELTDDVTMNDVTDSVETTVTIDLDPHYARMLAELRDEHGDVVDENLEAHVHNLISESYLEQR